MQKTITITFGDCAENHVGMQKIGEKSTNGFSYKDLKAIQKHFVDLGCRANLINLSNVNVNTEDTLEKAYVLIIKNAASYLLDNGNKDDLLRELLDLEWDQQAYMYGRVVNKKARYNLCFDNYEQEPDYQNGKGRIVDFDTVPLLKEIHENLQQIVGDEHKLVAEGNLYYDVTKCGIGFHGDGERKKVIGMRLGATIPLVYQWYQNSEAISDPIIQQISHGDVYVMSEKAVGYDWKKKIIPTLRHAAGANKFWQ